MTLQSKKILGISKKNLKFPKIPGVTFTIPKVHWNCQEKLKFPKIPWNDFGNPKISLELPKKTQIPKYSLE